MNFFGPHLRILAVSVRFKEPLDSLHCLSEGYLRGIYSDLHTLLIDVTEQLLVVINELVAILLETSDLLLLLLDGLLGQEESLSDLLFTWGQWRRWDY